MSSLLSAIVTSAGTLWLGPAERLLVSVFFLAKNGLSFPMGEAGSRKPHFGLILFCLFSPQVELDNEESSHVLLQPGGFYMRGSLFLMASCLPNVVTVSLSLA